jgi:hypothetical protein
MKKAKSKPAPLQKPQECGTRQVKGWPTCPFCQLARGLVQHRDLLVTCVKITSYNHHRSAPFFRALVVYSYQVYSEEGADNVI